MAYGRSGENARWVDGVLPYVISDDFDAGQRRVVRAAIRHWNERTIMRLVPRGSQQDFVLFAPADGSCQSSVGRVGGQQQIGCDVGDGFDRGSVIHEIGHCVGYFHEQQRPDRDMFVEVVEANIEAGKEGNFDIQFGGQVLGPYDYGSIMHYPRDAFSTGGDTIHPLQDVTIGQRDGLSDADVDGVCVLYGAPHAVVAWEDDLGRDGRRAVQVTGLARWGKHCWGPFEPAAGDAPRSAPNVALDAARAGYLVWQEGDDPVVRLRCVGVDGAERFGTLEVSSGPGAHEAPDVAVTAAGDVTVVWQTRLPGGGQEIRLRGFDRRGRERVAERLVTAGTAGAVPAGPTVAVGSSGILVVVWAELDPADSLSVRGRLLAPDGAAVFEPFLVADDLGDQDVFPRVAVGGGGDFVVVFERDLREIRARGFAADSSDRFAEQAVNVSPLGGQLTPDVAADPAGRFVVVWSDDRNQNGLGQVRVRGFTAEGAEALPERTANPRGGGDQSRPRVAVDQTGRRFLVWQDDEDSNGVYQVHAQGVDAAGAVFLKSFTVNTEWRGQQRRPVVATR